MFEPDDYDPEINIRHLQHISKDITEYMRELREHLITTSKIDKRVVEKLREMGIPQKVQDHDEFIIGLAKAWNMSIPGIGKFLERVSGKK